MEIPETQKVDINLLQVDGKNPNRLSKEQKEALKENIRKFGFIVPIITNKDYLIADGEHRWLIAKEMGFNEVPVVRLDIKEVDRRILRQVLNKLKGEHDWDLDLEEFKFFESEGKLEELKNLLGSEDDILRFLEETTEIKDQEINEKEYNENLETKNKCPSCGYEWS